MREIIVTDLTRFNARDKVCTAGIDLSTGECIRPMPYISEADRDRLNIHPGAILKGSFIKVNAPSPHIEDHSREQITYLGPCTEEQFKAALDASLETDIKSGFDGKIPNGEKYIPQNSPPKKSIITIKIAPTLFEIVDDKFKPGKIKANITDSKGNSFRYLPITDLDFFDYATSHQSRNDLDTLNQFIRRQSELYLRIGLSRSFEVNGKNGYWLQVNGIYTFPNFLKSMRGF